MGAQVDGAVARLEAEGVRVFFPPATFDMITVRAALVRDPEWNTIEFQAAMGEAP